MTASTPRTPIYLDNNASTELDPRVLECMTRVLRDDYGNPSSKLHAFGRRASDLVEEARERVASLIGASASEIIFTSGATESCNLALKGAAEAYGYRGNHVVTCLAEHEAVLEPSRRLGTRGFDVTWLLPDRYGRVSAEQVDKAMTDHTIVVSVMAANNLVGTINPTGEIGRVAKRRGVLFHCDATQAAGKIPVDVETMGIDLLSFSAHKLHGPKGVGALYVRGRSPKVRLSAQIDGGAQEQGVRSGTPNVPGIVAMGLACEIAGNQLDRDAKRLTRLRDRFLETLSQRLPGVTLNGHPRERLPNTLNIAFDGVEATELIENVSEIAASIGSACTSGTDDPHYVLRAMGLKEDHAARSVRFSLGRFTTDEEIDYCVARIVDAVEELRA
ncbi:MAG: cysteine desulfurase family protein, partial [Planctomycetota bacterium]